MELFNRNDIRAIRLTNKCFNCGETIQGPVFVSTNLFGNKYICGHDSCMTATGFCAVTNLPTFKKLEEDFLPYFKKLIPSDNLIDRKTWSLIAALLVKHDNFVGLNSIKKGLLQILTKQSSIYTEMKASKVNAFDKLESELPVFKKRDTAIVLWAIGDTVLPRDVILKIINFVV